MKKLLPKTVNNPQGFTLIELMVSITIVAIMAVAGIIVYTQVQQNARDARRREDLVAIATAIEGAKDPVSGEYSSVPATSLIGGVFPQDPLGSVYCISTSATKTHPADLTTANWTSRSTCPTTPGYANLTLTSTNSTTASPKLSWKVCALLEKGPVVICTASSQ